MALGVSHVEFIKRHTMMQAYTMVFGMGLPVDPNSTTAFFVGYSMIHTVGEIFSNAAYLVGYPMEDHGKCYGMFNGHYKVHGLSQLLSLIHI